MNNDALLAEFDQEMATTRNVLARLKDADIDYKPHEKSWTMGQLAKHVANIPMWGTMTMATDKLDLNSVPPEEPPASFDQIRAEFDANVVECRKAFEAAKPADWEAIWSMSMGDEQIMAMPRGPVVRAFILNHHIHHRAQLGVYLRLLDQPVPMMYGPTADEQ